MPDAALHGYRSGPHISKLPLGRKPQNSVGCTEHLGADIQKLFRANPRIAIHREEPQLSHDPVPAQRRSIDRCVVSVVCIMSRRKKCAYGRVPPGTVIDKKHCWRVNNWWLPIPVASHAMKMSPDIAGDVPRRKRGKPGRVCGQWHHSATDRLSWSSLPHAAILATKMPRVRFNRWQV